MFKNISIIKFFLIPQLIFLGSSCVNTKPTTYFNNGIDTTIYQKGADTEALIQKKDILSISITSLNQEASIVFNTTNNFAISTASVTGINTQANGYLVDANGYIQLPILGSLKADYLTKKELQR